MIGVRQPRDAHGGPPMLTETENAFVDAQPVARLATVDGTGHPHAVPICFARIADNVYFTIDAKPKRNTSRPLKRLRNISENPQVAVIVDHYEPDWSRLGWVMLRGRAEVIEAGPEHDRAQAALIERYPQYRDMPIAGLPVVAIRVTSVASWGRLTDKA